MARLGIPKNLPFIEVKVFSPYEIYFEGKAVSVSAKNETGPFDVFARHANFFTILLPGELRIHDGKRELKYQLGESIMKVAKDTVRIYVK